MDDQFDKDLKNRIREVFDNYEDPTADEGWLQLRKKFPEEQSNRRAILWLWRSAAAVLFLLLSIGLGLWLNHKPLPTQNLANKPVKHQQPINSIAAKQKPDSQRTPAPLTAATNNKGKHIQHTQQHKFKQYSHFKRGKSTSILSKDNW